MIDVTLVRPDHPVYAEMVGLLAGDVRFKLVGERFREGARSALPSNGRVSVASRLATAARRTVWGTITYTSLKTRLARRQVDAGGLVQVCGGVWSREHRWMADCENVNVLGFYDPAILGAPRFVRFLQDRLEDDSCRMVRVWSEAARRSFHALFDSDSVRRKVRVARPTVTRPPVGSMRSASAAPHLLFVGRGYWVKGGHIFLEVLTRLRARGVRFTATYIGDVAPEGEPWVRELGDVLTVKPPVLTRDEMWIQYGSADVCVMLGMADSYGLALVEAMACGCPVLAFRLHSGVSELVDLTGGGELVEPQDQLFDTSGLHRCHADVLVDRLRRTRQHASVDAVDATLSALIADAGRRAILGARGLAAVRDGILSAVTARTDLVALYRDGGPTAAVHP